MNRKQQYNLFQTWYDDPKVQAELFFTSLKFRETALIFPKYLMGKYPFNAVRCLRIIQPHGILYCLYNQAELHLHATPMNIYYSLAEYNGHITRMPPALNHRKHELEKFQEEHWKNIRGYDCFIDIDAPNHNCMGEAKEDTFKILLFLDNYNIPYKLSFSGMGYHIIIPGNVFEEINNNYDPDNPEVSVYAFYNDIIKSLSNEFTELIDLGIHDSRRVVKAPYTLAFYENETYICWPFNTVQEFIARNYQDYRLVWDEYKQCYTCRGITNIFRRGQRILNDGNIPDTKGFLEALRLTSWLRKE